MTKNQENKVMNSLRSKLKPAYHWLRPVRRVLSWLLVALVVFNLFEIDIKPRWDVLDLLTRIDNSQNNTLPLEAETRLESEVLPDAGVELPIVWGKLGQQLVELGVIDLVKFESLYAKRGGLSKADKRFLTNDIPASAILTKDNSSLWLNLLWAFGLANQNPILDTGPMRDPKYGGADRFASTGGWSLSKGQAMDHYSAHKLVTLTSKQQELVVKVSKNIYRPCCGNSTYFPDCNHGMAMLGLLQLMVVAGATEDQMYKTALQVNAFWFPDTYLTLAKYFAGRGVPWSEVKPKVVLGSAYSSATGFAEIRKIVAPVTGSGQGGGCGV